MNILVTGGAGFIGSHVCESLLSLGHKVICVDNFNDYYEPSIKRRNISAILNNKYFVLYEIDIRNADFRRIFITEKIDKVIHLAAMAGIRYSIKHPELYFDVNVVGTLNILKLCVEFNIKQIIFGSSSSVYGNNPFLPLKESYDPAPLSPYAYTKMLAEKICKFFSEYHNLNIICLRFFTVYGPRGRPDMAVYKFVKSIDENKEIIVYGKGELSRDFTYIGDIVEGILLSLKHSQKFEVINLSGVNAVKIVQLINIIEKSLNKKADIVDAPKIYEEAENTLADISKAEAILGFKPKTSIQEGIKKYIEWYKHGNKCE